MEEKNERIDLAAIERKAWRTCYCDGGLMDLAFGLILLAFSVAPIIREMFGYVYIAVLLLPAAFIVIGSRWIVAPRVGVVKFSKQRVRKQKRLRLLGAVGLVITFVLVLLTLFGVLPVTIGGIYFIFALGGAVIVIMGIFAHLKDFPNLFIYGIIIGGGLITAEILHDIVGTPLNSLIGFGITGTLSTLYGLIVLSRFVKKYPKTEV